MNIGNRNVDRHGLRHWLHVIRSSFDAGTIGLITTIHSWSTFTTVRIAIDTRATLGVPIARALTAIALASITLGTLTLGITLTELALAIVARRVVAIAIALSPVPLPSGIALETVALVSVALAPITLAILAPVAASFALLLALPIVALRLALPVLALRLLGGADRLALVAIFLLIALEIAAGCRAEAETVVERIALRLTARLVVAAALIAQDTEIMIGELQVIFGIDPVALHLRLTRHVAVFLVQLRRVAARAVVDPVAVVRPARTALSWVVPTAIAARAPATATATGLPIVDQAVVPCESNINAKTRYGRLRGRRRRRSQAPLRSSVLACHARETSAAT